MKSIKIKGCKRVSIRKHPWITPYAEDVVGDYKVSELPTLYAITEDKEDGRNLEACVDMRARVFDWEDNEFYPIRIRDKKGYIKLNENDWHWELVG